MSDRLVPMDIAVLDLRLAPMAGVTNAPFRLIARACGAGLLTSEEIDAQALVRDNARTRLLALHLPEERPLAMQLLGADPDVDWVMEASFAAMRKAGATLVEVGTGRRHAGKQTLEALVARVGEVSHLVCVTVLRAQSWTASREIFRRSAKRPRR